MITDFGQCQRYTVQLRNLNNFTDIKIFFRQNNIQRYIYILRYNDTVMKIGISHKVQEWADRIYTQIGHMPGWDRPLLKRGGDKIKDAVDKMIAKFPGQFHKDNVEVEILDFTNYNFFNKDTVYSEMQNAEEELKKEHFVQYGCYPVGNIKQEKIRFVPNKTVFDSIFSFEE